MVVLLNIYSLNREILIDVYSMSNTAPVLEESPTQPGYSNCNKNEAWLLWLSGLSTSLRIERSLVLFPVRAQAWAMGQVPSSRCVRGK